VCVRERERELWCAVKYAYFRVAKNDISRRLI